MMKRQCALPGMVLIAAMMLIGCGGGETADTGLDTGTSPATAREADSDTPSASPQSTGEPRMPDEPIFAAAAIADHPAYAVAFSGDVSIVASEGRMPVSVGAPIPDGRTLDVGADAYCDIQFGQRAVVRIGPNSRATVSTRLNDRQRPIMQLDLSRGSAVATVAELSAGEILRILTPSASYQVVGTEFAVSADDEPELAVREGAVAVWPRGLDAVALREQAAELYAEAASAGRPWDSAQAQAIQDAVDELGASVVVVSAGQQAALDRAGAEQANRLAAELEAKLRTLAEAEADRQTGLVAEFVALTQAANGVLASVARTSSAPSAELNEKLAMIDELRLLPIPKDPGNLSLLDEASGSDLVKFTLRTVPQDARIFIGDTFVGTSVYEGIFRRYESISVRVSKDGYRERRIQIDRARSEVVTVQLERLPPSISVGSFIKAIVAGDRSTVATYLREGGSPDVRDSDGVPAVVIATGLIPALTGETQELQTHEDILQQLLAAQANVDAAFTIEGEVFKPLHAAVLAGVAGMDAEPLIEQLLAAGASVNEVIAVQGEELTPLAIAIRWALYTGETREAIIKSLVAAGADLDVAIDFNQERLTLREVAGQLIRQGDLDDIELLRMLRQAGVAG